MCTALLQPSVNSIGFNKYTYGLMKYIIIIIVIIMNFYKSKSDSGAARSKA